MNFRCIFRPSLLAILFFFSCGIDNYVYMVPVSDSNLVWDAQNKKITFTLPSSQTDTYFDEYVIYYRIYPSNSYYDGMSITLSDLSTINSAMYSDYLKIEPYSIDDDEAPTALQTLFESTLGYKQLAFGIAVTDDSSLSSVTNVNNPLDEDSKGASVAIDFNLTAMETVHPTLIVDSSDNYRMLRDSDSDAEPSRDFFYSSSLDGDDIDSSFSSYSYGYVAFYIVAKGIDDSFTTVLSQATFLGVLQLPEN